MRMKKGFFIVLFLLASVFAFAGNFDYSYQLDDSSLNYEFGTSRTTIENGVKKSGWKTVKSTDNAIVLTKENQYFDGIKIHQLIYCFSNDKFSECSIIFQPTASEKIIIINHIIDCSESRNITFKGTNIDNNGLINYHYFDSDNNHLTFTIPNTESATIWAISIIPPKPETVQITPYIGKNLAAEYLTLQYRLTLLKDGTFIFVATGGNIDGMATGVFNLTGNKINFTTNTYSGKNLNLVFRQKETFRIEKATSDSLVLKNTNPPDAAFSIPINYAVK